MELEHLNRQPAIDPTAFIAPTAVILGDVELGPESSVWYGCILRGDVHRIRIGARVNLQDGTICHGQLDEFSVLIEDQVSVGHGAVLHGCTVRRGALIGIRASVLNGAEVGESAIVAAGAVVPPGMRVPPRTLVAGVPARVIRELTAQDEALLDYTWGHYLKYAEDFRRRGIVGRPPLDPVGGVFA